MGHLYTLLVSTGVSDPIEINRVWGLSRDTYMVLSFQTLSKSIGYGGLRDN